MNAKAASWVVMLAMAMSVASPNQAWAAGAKSEAHPKSPMDLTPWVERDASKRAAIKSRARDLGLEKIVGMASLVKAKLVVIDQVLLPMSRKPQNQVGPKELTEIFRQKGALIIELEEINIMLECLLEDEQAKSFGIQEL